MQPSLVAACRVAGSFLTGSVQSGLRYRYLRIFSGLLVSGCLKKCSKPKRSMCCLKSGKDAATVEGSIFV